jgi:hypothetical protein
MTSSMDKRVRRLENTGGYRNPAVGLADRIEQVFRLRDEDPERAAREDEDQWAIMQEDYRAGRLKVWGCLRLYHALARIRRDTAGDAKL